MGLRVRDGHWHYRFKTAGHEYTASTGLAATKRNESAARMVEAEARKLVHQGKAHLLKLEPKSFTEAADMFIEWAMGEHRDKPNTWRRLRGSCTSLKEFFRHRPLHTITPGDIEDYKSWRRRGIPEEKISGVREVTLRHDLHALAPLFRYGMKHNWCSSNPVEEVDIPSDKDAVRIHVVSPAEEMAYFAAAQQLGLGDLYDLGRLMILQGPRPSEVMQARAEDVDLAKGIWRIPDGKSAAAKRLLHLTQEARSILATRADAAGAAGWLFAGRKEGTHLQDIENPHHEVLEATGLAFVVYDFRHTFATRMAEKGCDIATLAAILGHANLRTVQRYIHIGEEHQKLAMVKYGEQQVEKAQQAESARLAEDRVQ
jgi:site-specific recombinase XerD